MSTVSKCQNSRTGNNLRPEMIRSVRSSSHAARVAPSPLIGGTNHMYLPKAVCISHDNLDPPYLVQQKLHVHADISPREHILLLPLTRIASRHNPVSPMEHIYMSRQRIFPARSEQPLTVHKFQREGAPKETLNFTQR